MEELGVHWVPHRDKSRASDHVPVSFNNKFTAKSVAEALGRTDLASNRLSNKEELMRIVHLGSRPAWCA